ncbi:hypothetical protein SLA2020_300260 [Shorea laevis]
MSSGMDYGAIVNGIGVFMVVLLITMSLLFFKYCSPDHHHHLPSHRTSTSARTAAAEDVSITIESGLNEETLRSFPKLLYSQAKLHETDNTSNCSICLGEYRDADTLRLLPNCGHVFHLKCVDPWLRLNPTCPVCRNSPLPSPSLPTPRPN